MPKIKTSRAAAKTLQAYRRWAPETESVTSPSYPDEEEHEAKAAPAVA